ncbi:hypothetical protein N9786_01050, partial [Flavobacteriaceae bacterium]|nr:hypothetical protein [Flavobacteriaceae bacterium]
IGTDAYTGGVIEFNKATEMSFAALPRYAGTSLAFTMKKGNSEVASTLDISLLDDVNALGETAALDLTISGPNTVAISTLDGKGGSITLSNVANATVTDYDGTIVVGANVITFSSNNVVSTAGSTWADSESITMTGVLDPNNTTGTGADKSGDALTFSALADLETLVLSGNWASVDVDGNGNLVTLTIDATVNNGIIDIDGNSDLTDLTLTGSSASGVKVNANNSLIGAVVDTTIIKTLATSPAATLDGSIIVTSNTDLETLTVAGSNVTVLTITGNVDLETITGTDLLTIGATVANNVVTISGNKFSAAVANDKTNATACTTCGALQANDLGAFTTTSGMNTLKVYLGLVAANTASTASVYFDTVESTTDAQGNEDVGETTAVGDVTVILKKTAAVAAVVTGATTGIKGQIAALINISALNSLSVSIDGVEVLHNGTAYGQVTMTGNSALDLVAIKSTLATTRATTLGTTLDVTARGNSAAPAIDFLATITSTSAGNGEYYNNSEVAALGNTANISAFLTSYDNVTMSIGGLSVTSSITVASATGSVATNMIANALDAAWDLKYGAAGTSSELSTWANTTSVSGGGLTIASKASTRGSRGWNDLVSISLVKGTAAQVSIATAGVVTQTSKIILDWVIGTVRDTSDNNAIAPDLIVTLTEVTNKVASAGQATISIDSAQLAAPNNGGIILASTSFPNANSGAGTATSTAALTYPLEARLDVINEEAGDEGIITTAAILAVAETRVHWL